MKLSVSLCIAAVALAGLFAPQPESLDWEFESKAAQDAMDDFEQEMQKIQKEIDAANDGLLDDLRKALKKIKLPADRSEAKVKDLREAERIEAAIAHLMTGESAPFKRIPRNVYRYRKSYYKFYPEPLTWEQARKFCESVGGRLACIETEAEFDALCDYLESELPPDADRDVPDIYPWIGGTDADKEGEWVWINGASVDDKLFSPGKPEGGQQQNAAFLDTRGIDDHDGSALLPCLCEWD